MLTLRIMKAPIDVGNKQMEPFGSKKSSLRELCHETDIEKGRGIKELVVNNDFFKFWFMSLFVNSPNTKILIGRGCELG